MSLNAIAFQAFLSILGLGFRFSYWLAWRFDGYGFEGVATLVFGFDNHLHALLCVVLLEVVDACVGKAYAAFAIASWHLVLVAGIAMNTYALVWGGKAHKPMTIREYRATPIAEIVGPSAGVFNFCDGKRIVDGA